MLIQMLEHGNYVPIIQSANIISAMEEADRIAKRHHRVRNYKLIGENHSDVLAIGISDPKETKEGLGILWSWKG